MCNIYDKTFQTFLVCKSFEKSSGIVIMSIYLQHYNDQFCHSHLVTLLPCLSSGLLSNRLLTNTSILNTDISVIQTLDHNATLSSEQFWPCLIMLKGGRWISRHIVHNKASFLLHFQNLTVKLRETARAARRPLTWRQPFSFFQFFFYTLFASNM